MKMRNQIVTRQLPQPIVADQGFQAPAIPVEEISFHDRASLFTSLPKKHRRITLTILFHGGHHDSYEAKHVSQVRARTILDRALTRAIKGKGPIPCSLLFWDEHLNLIREVDIQAPEESHIQAYSCIFPSVGRRVPLALVF